MTSLANLDAFGRAIESFIVAAVFHFACAYACDFGGVTDAGVAFEKRIACRGSWIADCDSERVTGLARIVSAIFGAAHFDWRHFHGDLLSLGGDMDVGLVWPADGESSTALANARLTSGKVDQGG
jgi:hypothetical protein